MTSPACRPRGRLRPARLASGCPSRTGRSRRRGGPDFARGSSCADGACYKRRPVSIDRIPLPDQVPGRLYATGFSDVGPDADAALASVDADLLLCLLTAQDIAMRFPRFTDWLDINAAGGR